MSTPPSLLPGADADGSLYCEAPGRKYFAVTSFCARRVPVLATPARRAEAIERLAVEPVGRHVQAWAVLPDHHHLLLCLGAATQNAGKTDFSVLGRRIGRWHRWLSRRWNREDGATGRTVWKGRHYREITSARLYAMTLHLLHTDPVRHGFAATPGAWDASSFHAYRRRDLQKTKRA